MIVELKPMCTIFKHKNHSIRRQHSPSSSSLLYRDSDWTTEKTRLAASQPGWQFSVVQSESRERSVILSRLATRDQGGGGVGLTSGVSNRVCSIIFLIRTCCRIYYYSIIIILNVCRTPPSSRCTPGNVPRIPRGVDVSWFVQKGARNIIRALAEESVLLVV